MASDAPPVQLPTVGSALPLQTTLEVPNGGNGGESHSQSHSQHQHNEHCQHRHGHRVHDDEEAAAHDSDARRNPPSFDDAAVEIRDLLRRSPLYGSFEAFIAMFEYVLFEFGGAFVAKAVSSQLPPANSITQCGSPPTLACYLQHDFAQLFVGLLLSVLFTALCFRYFLWRYKPLLQASHFSMKAPTQVFYHGIVAYVISGAIMLALASWAQPPQLSLGNFKDSSGQLNYYSSAQMLLFVPLKEEMLFRATLYVLLSDRQQKEMPAMLLCSLFFGGFHILNALFNQQTFSVGYVLLQIFFGYLVGAFYGMQFIRTGSIFESSVLHALNNVFASFLPLSMAFDPRDLVSVWRLFSTVVVHLLLIASAATHLHKKWK